MVGRVEKHRPVASGFRSGWCSRCRVISWCRSTAVVILVWKCRWGRARKFHPSVSYITFNHTCTGKCCWVMPSKITQIMEVWQCTVPRSITNGMWENLSVLQQNPYEHKKNTMQKPRCEECRAKACMSIHKATNHQVYPAYWRKAMHLWPTSVKEETICKTHLQFHTGISPLKSNKLSTRWTINEIQI